MKKITIVSAILVLCTVFFGCKPKEDNSITLLSEKQITLNHKGTHQINATSDAEISYSVENEYHAEVNNIGFVTARYVGNTSIILRTIEDVKKVNITVTPKYNLYSEPQISFGMTKSEVIRILGNPDINQSTGIGYANYCGFQLVCTFNSYGLLEGYALTIGTSYSTTLNSFLGERYFYVGYSSGYNVYQDALLSGTPTKYVSTTIYNVSYYMVMYVKPDNNKASIFDCTINEIKKILNDLVQ